MRQLVQDYPADWLAFLGHRAIGPVEVVDANLLTVSAEVDKVMRITGPDEWVVHLEFQTSYDATIGPRLLRYNSMLHLEHRAPVESVLVLLRRSADGPAITGRYQIALPARGRYLSFEYTVRRIWREPAADLLHGPVGTLPLVPLGRARQSELVGLLRAVDERFTQEASVDSVLKSVGEDQIGS